MIMETSTRSRPAAQGTAPVRHPARAVEAAGTTSELIAATEKCRAREVQGADGYYSAGEAVYQKLRKTSRWGLRIDKILTARKIRKLYFNAAAHMEEAARNLSAAIAEEEQMLGGQKASSGDFAADK
jgi:hypothetical protein